MLEFFKKRKLQVDILTLFLCLLLTSFAIIITFTYRNNSKTVKSIAENIISQVTATITEGIGDLLNDAQRLAETSSATITSEAKVNLNNIDLLYYMYLSLYYYPNVDAIYFGMNNGTFLEYYRLLPGTAYRNDLSKPLPSNYKFAISYIDYVSVPPKEMWIYQDNDEKTLEIENVNNPTYDPRTRPWYHGAFKKGDLYWTDIYVFAQSEAGEPGITAAYPIWDAENNIYGVAGVDLSLVLIGNVLDQQKIGKSGKAFIVSDTGQALVAPTSWYEKGSSQPQLKDQFLEAYKEFKAQNRSPLLFKYNGVEYMGALTPFSLIPEKHWYIEIVVPVNDFLSRVILINEETLIISLVIAVISAFFVAYFARRVARPIVKLAEEVNEIKQLRLEGDIDVHSNIVEINFMATSLAAMKAAFRSFAVYVPNEIVHGLLQQGQDIKLGGERKEVTLFFSDIYDFSAFSEKYSPEMLMPQLAEYFDTLSKIILESNGTIDKYIGDNIMAFWNAPAPVEDHAFLGCKSALLCQNALTTLNEKWIKMNEPELITRIGIHSGEAIIGNIGTKERMNYTAIGDAVNLASRLEVTNKTYHTKIIISEETYKKVSARFLVRPLDIITVKGKERTTKIYELLAQNEGDPKIAPTPAMIEFCKEYTKAYTLFLEQKWQEAKEIFEELLKKNPSDHPTALHLERCSNYLKNPPGPTWDGVTRLKEK